MTRLEEIVQEAKCREREEGFTQLVKDTKSLYSAYGIGFLEGAEWADSTAWKPADGDNFPEIDREVIALVEENGNYKVVYAHRPPECWDSRNIITNEVTCNYTKRYDKGEWNQPNVKWWLDLELPKMEE